MFKRRSGYVADLNMETVEGMAINGRMIPMKDLQFYINETETEGIFRVVAKKKRFAKKGTPYDGQTYHGSWSPGGDMPVDGGAEDEVYEDEDYPPLGLGGGDMGSGPGLADPQSWDKFSGPPAGARGPRHSP